MRGWKWAAVFMMIKPLVSRDSRGGGKIIADRSGAPLTGNLSFSRRERPAVFFLKPIAYEGTKLAIVGEGNRFLEHSPDRTVRIQKLEPVKHGINIENDATRANELKIDDPSGFGFEISLRADETVRVKTGDDECLIEEAGRLHIGSCSSKKSNFTLRNARPGFMSRIDTDDDAASSIETKFRRPHSPGDSQYGSSLVGGTQTPSNLDRPASRSAFKPPASANMLVAPSQKDDDDDEPETGAENMSKEQENGLVDKITKRLRQEFDRALTKFKADESAAAAKRRRSSPGSAGRSRRDDDEGGGSKQTNEGEEERSSPTGPQERSSPTSPQESQGHNQDTPSGLDEVPDPRNKDLVWVPMRRVPISGVGAPIPQQSMENNPQNIQQTTSAPANEGNPSPAPRPSDFPNRGMPAPPTQNNLEFFRPPGTGTANREQPVWESNRPEQRASSPHRVGRGPPAEDPSSDEQRERRLLGKIENIVDDRKLSEIADRIVDKVKATLHSESAKGTAKQSPQTGGNPLKSMFPKLLNVAAKATPIGQAASAFLPSSKGKDPIESLTGDLMEASPLAGQS